MNRSVWENLLSLYSVQVINYAIPLLVLPFLARALGPAEWGKLAFAESYAIYVSLLVDYGFGLSASREIASAREDVSVRSHQLANVPLAQLMLAGLAAVISVLFVAVSPRLAVYLSLLPIAFLYAVFRSLTPFWYFQGLERMRLVAILNIAVNASAAAAIFLLVRRPADYWIPVALRAVAAAAACLIAFGIACRETPLRRPRISFAWDSLRTGFSLFLFRSAVSLYTSANVLLLGAMASETSVAFFAGAEKLAKVSSGALDPITQTFYPRIVNLLKKEPERAMRAARLSLTLNLTAGLAVGLVILLGAPLLVKLLLGPGFERSIPVLRIFSVLPPVIGMSVVLGVQWMLPLRMDWAYIQIIVVAGALNIALAVLLVPRYHEIGMAISVVVAEIVVSGGVLGTLWLRRVDPWRPVPAQEPEPELAVTDV